MTVPLIVAISFTHPVCEKILCSSFIVSLKAISSYHLNGTILAKILHFESSCLIGIKHLHVFG